MPKQKGEEFIEVNSAASLIKALNANRRALANGTRPIKEASQENIALGKILITVRTAISTSIAADEKPDMSFFTPPEPEKPKAKTKKLK